MSATNEIFKKLEGREAMGWRRLELLSGPPSRCGLCLPSICTFSKSRLKNRSTHGNPQLDYRPELGNHVLHPIALRERWNRQGPRYPARLARGFSRDVKNRRKASVIVFTRSTMPFKEYNSEYSTRRSRFDR